MTNVTFNFGHRKIQKVRYSFMVPLPVDWVKNMRIGKGDSLKIEMQKDKSLRITPIPEACPDYTGTRSSTPSTKEEMLLWRL